MKIEIHNYNDLPANEYHGAMKRSQVAKYIMTFAELDLWLNTADDETRDLVGLEKRHMLPDDIYDTIGDYAQGMFDCMSDSVRDQIETFGVDNDHETITVTIYWDADKRMHWVLHQFEGVRADINHVMKSYEHTSPLAKSWGPMLPDLGGDDDVDYSGSYVDTGIDIVERFLAAHVDDVTPTNLDPVDLPEAI